MIKALISDVSRVLLFPKDKNYQGSLNGLHKDTLGRPSYKFFDYFELNVELLNYYKSLQNKLDLYIFTSESIQDAPELQPHWNGVFTKIFSALKMNTNKKDPNAYRMLITDINLKPEEVIYIDDNAENIQAASSVGLQTIQYLDNQSCYVAIQEKVR